MAEASATAEGELARTPLAHLLVYALDRRLTGALFLATKGGCEHVVRLVRGVPVKVRPGDGFSLLGEMLVGAGAIDAQTLEAALATKGLLGDVLLLAGRIERDTLESVAEAQFVKRMVRLFALPPETTYRYHDGNEELAEYGGDPACIDPLALLWAGLKTHGELSAMMEPTLARLGETPLKLSPGATVARFGLEADEAALLDAITAGPSTLAEMCTASSPGLVRRFVYALAITRQLEMGTGLLPVGTELGSSGAQRSSSPPGTAVGRLALRSTVHRVGAAAPDAPGDGERGPAAVSSRRMRDRPGARGSLDEPPSSGSEAPVSSVQSVPVPESGVVEVAPAASDAPAVLATPEGAASVLDRATAVESSTLRSAIGSIEDLRASAPDLEGIEANPEEVAAALAAEAEEENAPPGTAVEAARVELEDAPAPVDEREQLADGAAVSDEEAPAVEAEPSEAFAGMSSDEIYWLASECLAERDMVGAVEACEAGRKLAPDDPDLAALDAWAKAQHGGADIKALAVALDAILGAHEGHVQARYYRGMLRRRLGDEEGSLRDLHQVIELSPEHEGAALAVAAAERRQKPVRERPSLFGKLFKR